MVCWSGSDIAEKRVRGPAAKGIVASGLIAGLTLTGLGLSVAPGAHANQQYAPLADSVRSTLSASVADAAAPTTPAALTDVHQRWLAAMSARLSSRIDDADYREMLLNTVHYEATRAGLDPQLVLSVIQVESSFRKYAISTAGARGYMQVMPFWVDLLGDTTRHNLFHLRTNLRFGCTILRHYLDIEDGDLFRALGRYNGSLGRAEYPDRVRTAWERHWTWNPEEAASDNN